MGGIVGASLCPLTLKFYYDRILMMESEPFFPIGVEFEMRNQYHLLDTVGFNCVFLEQDFNYGGLLDTANYGIISVDTHIFENPPNYSNPENLYALADTAQKYGMYIFGDYWSFHRPSYRAFPPVYSETLADRLQGRGAVLWSPKAKHLPTGTYFVRLTTGSITRTVRVIYAH